MLEGNFISLKIVRKGMKLEAGAHCSNSRIFLPSKSYLCTPFILAIYLPGISKNQFDVKSEGRFFLDIHIVRHDLFLCNWIKSLLIQKDYITLIGLQQKAYFSKSLTLSGDQKNVR